MKFKITFLLIFLISITNAQVTNEGKPASWEINTINKIEAITMPGFDLAKLEAEDRVNDAGKNKPWRYGYEFLVDHNLQNNGEWTVLPNGDRIWRIRYYSQGAHTMNFLFSDYYMPRGAKVYLYNNERTDLLGAYDAAQNNEQRVLGTWLVSGQDIWIEYYEPADVKGLGKLEIFKVVHGYRSVPVKSPDNDLNSSGSCNYDVDCDISGINELKDINKRAVGLIIVANNSFCTGALINNTSNDGTPYFLTANHCTEPDENFSQWAFRFNWISPNPVCGQNQSSTSNAPNYYQTVSGAELKARREESDFCLIKITANMPSTWNTILAGWNRSETPAASSFGIHHPSGDIMKVSRDYDPPVLDNGFGQFMWEVQSWDLGVTEPGSSGSPLFDNNGRIIGQLYGGSSECQGTVTNGGDDFYGRFSKSWNAGSGSSTRLKDWLDPGNTNATTINYKQLGTAGIEDAALHSIKIYPNASYGVFRVDSAEETEYAVYSILGQIVTEGRFTSGDNTINLSGLSNGVYILKITDVAGKTANYKLVKE